MLRCLSCLAAVRQHGLILTRHYHTSAFHPHYCSIWSAGFHVYSGPVPQILDPQAMQFEPSYSLLAVLQQYGTPER